MTRLHDLYEEQGQSPWVDNIRRDSLADGSLAALVEQGIRGVTSNPTIFAKAIEDGSLYDGQFASLLVDHTVEEAYWEMTITDIIDALGVLRPVYDTSDSTDGFVSIEVSPALAHDTAGTIEAAASSQAHRPAQPLREDPWHRRRAPRCPHDDRRGPKHQHHSPLLARALCRGHRGLSRRARGPARLGSRRSLGRPQRRLVLREQGRHRGRPPPRTPRGWWERQRNRGHRPAPGRQLALDAGHCGRGAGAPPTNSSRAASADRWEVLAAKGARVQRPLWASTSTKKPRPSPTSCTSTPS